MRRLYKLQEHNIIDDDMNDAKNESHEKKMEMWKMRDELLNSMSDKELRAFIKGYMMAQRMAFKQIKLMHECGCGSCQGGQSESCGCGNKECNCGKE